MVRKFYIIAGFLVLVAILAAGFAGTRALAQTGGDDDPAGADDDGPDTPITGGALNQASDAALSYMGGGRVTGAEVGDEEGYYEIEVTLDDGSQVDVHLDEAFNVLSTEGEGPGDD